MNVSIKTTDMQPKELKKALHGRSPVLNPIENVKRTMKITYAYNIHSRQK